MFVEELIQGHGPRLWGLCRSLAGNTEDAEDLYQQTFLRALECEAKLDPEQNPGAWLCATAAGLWKSRLRKVARRNALAPPAPEETLEFVPSGEEPEAVLLRQERVERVHLLLDGLKEKYRLPLVLYYSGGLTVPELAAALHLPQGTVKSRLSRARTQIKQSWEEWNCD